MISLWYQMIWSHWNIVWISDDMNMISLKYHLDIKLCDLIGVSFWYEMMWSHSYIIFMSHHHRTNTSGIKGCLISNTLVDQSDLWNQYVINETMVIGQNCRDNTAGDRCEQCAAGYYQDRARRCLPCPCPLTMSPNQFSPVCELSTDSQVTCLACPEGYTGRQCERSGLVKRA